MKRSFGEVDHSINFNVANVLMMLSRGAQDDDVTAPSTTTTTSSCSSGGRVPCTPSYSSPAGRRVFECKTCCRQFPSFQALGGHRASHKKPKLPGEVAQAAQPKAKVHGCSICGLEFAVGQALGGHMRRHRAPTTTEGFGHGFVEKKSPSPSNGKRLLLDLNLPPLDDVAIESRKVVGLELRLGLACI